ncbi:hypothetical protein DITRI_Ditri15bG0049300 [Diplodiscus trichospermus]
MSRCFPFPPPGYQKKARTDDVDLLKKEKQKEKKHKKEKKDKEKGENKDKKEKDRSDGKRKDKKDKKEKHKDKKKEKDKEKDRSNNSEEKFPGSLEGQNGEKNLDEKKFPGKYEGNSGEKFIQKEKVRDKEPSSDKKLNGEKISQNSHLAEDFRDPKFVQELGRRFRDEGAGAGKQLVDKFMVSNQKRDEEMVRLVDRTANTLGEEKEKKKKSDARKLDVPGFKEESRSGGNAMVKNLARAIKGRVEGVPRQVESNIEARSEGKEKSKEKDSDDKIKDKRKDRDRDKKGHGKEKDRDKEKKDKDRDKEKKEAKAKGEYVDLEQDNLKVSNKDDPVGTSNLKTSCPSNESNKGAVIEENHRKRKVLEKNGFLHGEFYITSVYQSCWLLEIFLLV